MTLAKEPPFRSRKLLEAAKDQACVLCEKQDGTIVAAHYSGRYSMSVGKCWGEKSSDHVAAHLCGRCHAEMDGYAAGNDDARAIRFFLAIFETQRRLFARGVLKANLENYANGEWQT